MKESMKEAFKNKNLLVIIFEIIIIILGIIGITFATSKLLNDRTSTLITADEYHLDYQGDSSITISNIEPISDSMVNINTKDNVIRAAFSVRGVNTNKETNLIYDVMLNEMNIDCSLLNEYTKWRLYKNGSLLSEGNLSPSFDGDVLSDNMHLTTIQESLPKYNENYDNYVLLFWISEACDNLTTCKLIDQSNIVDSSFSAKVFIALYSGTKKAYTRTSNSDNSCANKPILTNNMVPVTYQNGVWVVADESNQNKNSLWYDYSNQNWANAIITDSNKYQNVGTIIDENDVLAWYVWIPRFRYKLWNAKAELTDSYAAYNEGIDIIFENGVNKITNNENDKYLTHPAFGDNLRGFWISKYELSNSGDTYKFARNSNSYRGDTIDNYKQIITNLTENYKLGTKAESHMITNYEWGATAYLSHSKYGLCVGDGCSSMGVNDSYLSGANKQDTTTRNVYGVYDMAGASGEYAMGTSEGLGYATNEVILPDHSTWYNALSLISNREYLVRGGINTNIFHFGDISMDAAQNSTRGVIINKEG